MSGASISSRDHHFRGDQSVASKSSRSSSGGRRRSKRFVIENPIEESALYLPSKLASGQTRTSNLDCDRSLQELDDTVASVSKLYSSESSLDNGERSPTSVSYDVGSMGTYGTETEEVLRHLTRPDFRRHKSASERSNSSSHSKTPRSTRGGSKGSKGSKGARQKRGDKLQQKICETILNSTSEVSDSSYNTKDCNDSACRSAQFILTDLFHEASKTMNESALPRPPFRNGTSWSQLPETDLLKDKPPKQVRSKSISALPPRPPECHIGDNDFLAPKGTRSIQSRSKSPLGNTANADILEPGETLPSSSSPPMVQPIEDPSSKKDPPTGDPPAGDPFVKTNVASETRTLGVACHGGNVPADDPLMKKDPPTEEVANFDNAPESGAEAGRHRDAINEEDPPTESPWFADLQEEDGSPETRRLGDIINAADADTHSESSSVYGFAAQEEQGTRIDTLKRDNTIGGSSDCTGTLEFSMDDSMLLYSSTYGASTFSQLESSKISPVPELSLSQPSDEKVATDAEQVEEENAESCWTSFDASPFEQPMQIPKDNAFGAFSPFDDEGHWPGAEAKRDTPTAIDPAWDTSRSLPSLLPNSPSSVFNFFSEDNFEDGEDVGAFPGNSKSSSLWNLSNAANEGRSPDVVLNPGFPF